MHKKRGRPEDELQKEVAKHLNRSLPKGYVSSTVENSRGKNMGEQQRLKARGLRAGFPDHVVLGPQNTHPIILIELKTKTGCLTES